MFIIISFVIICVILNISLKDNENLLQKNIELTIIAKNYDKIVAKMSYLIDVKYELKEDQILKEADETQEDFRQYLNTHK